MRLVYMAMALVGLASGARAADPAEGTLITDPAALASLGFAPDAVVYVAPGASEVTPGPQQYGATDPIMVAHSGLSFRGRQSTYAYTTGGGHGEVIFAGGDNFADAPVQLPSGAIWENTRVWVNDANQGAAITVFLFRSCLPPALAGLPVTTQLASEASSSNTGEQSFVITPPNQGPVIDNNGCHYWIRVRFDAPGLILYKARSQYRLQVSPAPAAATFPNDVPTSHPFFRFVEAMAKSGLTGGCGPGSFCPNDPVTRGQLSVFLAVALGLHFPN